MPFRPAAVVAARVMVCVAAAPVASADPEPDPAAALVDDGRVESTPLRVPSRLTGRCSARRV